MTVEQGLVTEDSVASPGCAYQLPSRPQPHPLPQPSSSRSGNTGDDTLRNLNRRNSKTNSPLLRNMASSSSSTSANAAPSHSGAAMTNSSSSAGAGNQYHIPQELQEVLLDFTVQYLIEQPDDLTDFALNYFSRLRRKKEIEEENRSDESMISEDDHGDEQPSYTAIGRRKSVFAEAYNPEEDEDDEKPVIHPKSDTQRKSLLEAVKGILLFRSLDPEQLGEVLDAMFQLDVVPGQNIITQGADGDNFYVIESGEYNIFVIIDGKDKFVGKYDNQGSFGELALMYNMPRAATIKAVGTGVLWAMDRSTFRRIVLKSAFQKRKMYESLLETVPLLASLSSYERMNLADALVTKSYPDREIVVHQGDPADGMYFVEAGEILIVMVGNDGIERNITTIKKGGYFGELALVTHKPRAATAKASGPVKLAFLDVHAFERLLGPCMDVMKRNIEDYEDQLVQIFGSRTNISDIR